MRDTFENYHATTGGVWDCIRVGIYTVNYIVRGTVGL